MQSRPPTIATVAEAAHVSRMTVSKVLRGTGRISADTRARVLGIAEALGYVPNGLAGALSSQTSHVVGVIIPSISDQVYAGVLSGINAVLVPGGFTSLIGETFFDPGTEMQVLRMMLGMKPAGLILTGGLARDPAARHLLRQSGVRVVQLWDGDRPDFSATVGLSHRAAGRMAADVFLGAGLRDVAYIGAQLERDLCAGLRREGFAGQLRAAGARLTCVTDADMPRSTETGFALTARLLAQPARPQAIHYLNDAMAIGGLRALIDAGVSVPGEVSVMGFNGTSLASAVRTRLTTLYVPVHDVGTAAARALISPEAPGTAAAVQLIPVTLVQGTTVAAAGRAA